MKINLTKTTNRHFMLTPSINAELGIVERKNHTLNEMMNALFISSMLPQNMWSEAILSANYIINKVPRKKMDKTPYELGKGRKFFIQVPMNVRVFCKGGCTYT